MTIMDAGKPRPELPSEIGEASARKALEAAREALIAKYAESAKRNAVEMSTMPLGPVLQHFREFADELAALASDVHGWRTDEYVSTHADAIRRAFQHLHDTDPDEDDRAYYRHEIAALNAVSPPETRT